MERENRLYKLKLLLIIVYYTNLLLTSHSFTYIEQRDYFKAVIR